MLTRRFFTFAEGTGKRASGREEVHETEKDKQQDILFNYTDRTSRNNKRRDKDCYARKKSEMLSMPFLLFHGFYFGVCVSIEEQELLKEYQFLMKMTFFLTETTLEME